VAAGAAFFGFLSKAKSENDLRQGGRIPGRFGPGSPKLLRRPRTDFPSLLPNNRLRSGRNAAGKQTIPGSVRQLPPQVRIDPGRRDRALVGARLCAHGVCLSGFQGAIFAAAAGHSRDGGNP